MTCYGCPDGCSRCGNYRSRAELREELRLANEATMKELEKMKKAEKKQEKNNAAGGGTKVYTEATCGFCRFVTREEGAHGDCPPVEWAELKLSKRFAGEGWTNNETMRWLVCPECQKKFAHFIKQNGSA